MLEKQRYVSSVNLRFICKGTTKASVRNKHDAVEPDDLEPEEIYA